VSAGRTLVLPFLLLLLSGCAGQATAVDVGAGVPPAGTAAAPVSPVAPAPVAAPSAPALPSDPAGPGAMVGTISAPVAAQGYAVVAVTCTQSAVGYRMQVSGAQFGATRMDADVNIPAYSGSGQYDAVVTAGVIGPDGVRTAATASGVTVVIRDDGAGALRHAFSQAGAAPLALAFSWRCS
jgi:hypothetical protein